MEEVQAAVHRRVRVLLRAGGQRPGGPGLHADGPHAHVGVHAGGPAARRRGGGDGVLEPARVVRHRRDLAVVVAELESGDLIRPKHLEVRVCHFVLSGKVDPDLKQLQGIFRLVVHQGKHLGVRDALAGGHPLAVSEAEPAGASQGVGVVAQAFARDGDGLKAAVRVFREAGHRLPVVHAPPVFAAEVLADGSPSKLVSDGPHGSVSFWVGIVVVNTKEEWVLRPPWRLC
mmetsp:Transcript_3437/g.6794  ORF Transcript_3437/g.6794 Transcript_3437/m.6794 type:complete len:230 (+) Transcript_3437:577-1266(+)